MIENYRPQTRISGLVTKGATVTLCIFCEMDC